MDWKKLCRLCSDFSDDFVDIFQYFEDSTIAAILTKHFGFMIYKNDGSSDCLCQTCWTHTKDFHIFHKKTETLQKNHLQSNDFVEQHNFNSHENQTANSSSSLVIKLERSPSPMDTVEETSECIFKAEEMNPAIAFDLQIQREVSFDANCDPSQSADDDNNQTSSKLKQKSRNNGGTRTTNRSKNGNSKRDTATEDAQIRQFCQLKCDICCVQFEIFAEAKDHFRTVHNTAGYLTCCRKKFFLRYRALEHIQRHLNPQKFQCYICGNHFATKDTLKNHFDIHEPLDSRAFKCDMCSSSFTKPWKLKNHKRKQHCPEEDKKFHCDKCKKNFVTKSILDYHIRGVHDSVYTRVCHICAKVCKRRTNFRKHMQLHHAALQPKLQCYVCGSWLKHADSLQKHLKRHQDTETANCSVCNKVLRKSSLKIHMREVHGEKSHKCTICDKAFAKLFVLQEHMTIHTGKFQYTCRYCTSPFKTKANMRYHHKKVHLEELTRDRLKRFSPK